MCEKVLLVSNDDQVIERVLNVIKTVVPTAIVHEARTAEEAVDVILANGFELTILDSKIQSKKININKLIKINFTSSKNLIILSKRSIERKLEKIFNKPIKEVPRVLNVVDEAIDVKLGDCVANLKNLGKPTGTETFKSIYSDIQKAKSEGIFFKYPFLQII